MNFSQTSSSCAEAPDFSASSLGIAEIRKKPMLACITMKVANDPFWLGKENVIKGERAHLGDGLFLFASWRRMAAAKGGSTMQ